MKCIGTMVVLLFANCSAIWGQALRRDVPSLPPVARRSVVKPALHTLRAQATRLPASVGPNVTQTTCPADAAAAGAVCGYVKVALIREHPGGAKIGIYFELYQHSGAGPAQSVILANFGGPGLPTASGRGFPLFLFASNLDVHDLLLIDDRGTGMSGAIDCEELQHGTEPFVDSVADCSEHLGEAANVYGAGDIAKDVEAVRVALGYDLVDYFGASYGGADATAYVTRFGQHVRSVVLDAPYGAPALAPFAIEHYRATSDPSVVKLDCLRSPTCAQDHPQPVKEFADLVEDLREHSIQGDAYDAFGNLLHVTLDEKALLNDVVHSVSGDFTNTGELLAAGRSLEHGDTAPLLRLEAEGFSTLVGDYGDPVFYSNGAFYATGCSNAQQVWAWSDPYAERKAKYAEAVTDLPADYFAPYSRDAATGLVFSHVGKRCLSWQEGDDKPSPVVPPHAIYPHAPTLVLEGDLDNRVPLAETDKVAASFPNHTAITIAEAGHETVGWSQCARDLVAQFIENLVVGDTRCAGTPETVWPAVGRFPILARDARQLKSTRVATIRFLGTNAK